MVQTSDIELARRTAARKAGTGPSIGPVIQQKAGPGLLGAPKRRKAPLAGGLPFANPYDDPERRASQTAAFEQTIQPQIRQGTDEVLAAISPFEGGRRGASLLRSVFQPATAARAQFQLGQENQATQFAANAPFQAAPFLGNLGGQTTLQGRVANREEAEQQALDDLAKEAGFPSGVALELALADPGAVKELDLRSSFQNQQTPGVSLDTPGSTPSGARGGTVFTGEERIGRENLAQQVRMGLYGGPMNPQLIQQYESLGGNMEDLINELPEGLRDQVRRRLGVVAPRT